MTDAVEIEPIDFDLLNYGSSVSWVIEGNGGISPILSALDFVRQRFAALTVEQFHRSFVRLRSMTGEPPRAYRSDTWRNSYCNVHEVWPRRQGYRSDFRKVSRHGASHLVGYGQGRSAPASAGRVTTEPRQPSSWGSDSCRTKRRAGPTRIGEGGRRPKITFARLGRGRGEATRAMDRRG